MPKPAYITSVPLPVADFTATPTSGVVPLTVLFTNNSANGPILSWKWERRPTGTIPWTEFGSGAQIPTETFSSTGDYDIQLTVTNSIGSNTKTSFACIHVTAVPITHTITASAAGPVGSGTISPSGAVPVNDMGSQLFTITSNPGYHITDVVVNGTYSQGAVTSYTFTNVIADHTISATFAANTPQTLYYNGFNTSGSWNDNWNPTNANRLTAINCGGGNNPPCVLRNDAASIRLNSGGVMYRTISTSGYTNIAVSFYMGVYSLSGSENIQAQWRPNASTSWTTLKQITAGTSEANDNAPALYYYSYTDSAFADKANFALRFILSSGTNSQDFGIVDDVKVIGTLI
jgi:PKD repeat protein